MIENIDGSMWQMPEQKQGMFKTGFLTRVQESRESIVNVSLKLWRQMNYKGRAQNKMHCDNRENYL